MRIPVDTTGGERIESVIAGLQQVRCLHGTWPRTSKSRRQDVNNTVRGIPAAKMR